jgi:thiol-disulfide isomerase/thioredoxin
MTSRAASLVSAVAAVTLLAACSATPGASSAAPDKGYVSGDGSVRVVAPSDRKAAISLSGKTIEGVPLDVSTYRGKVVVVNVWGSWCDPCQREATALERSWQATRDNGVQFVGVDIRDQASAARAFQRKKGITYPSLDGADGRALLAFRGTLPPNAIPSTIVLDRQGRVSARVLGPVTETTLTSMVEDVLAEQR